MYRLKKIVSESKKPVYVHLSDKGTAERFIFDAENQRFTFPDGAKPGEKSISDFYALHSDMTLNYIGSVGRTAFQCKAEGIIPLEYESFLCEGEKEK